MWECSILYSLFDLYVVQKVASKFLDSRRSWSWRWYKGLETPNEGRTTFHQNRTGFFCSERRNSSWKLGTAFYEWHTNTRSAMFLWISNCSFFFFLFFFVFFVLFVSSIQRCLMSANFENRWWRIYTPKCTVFFWIRTSKTNKKKRIFSEQSTRLTSLEKKPNGP